jgi:peptide/nickel transport system permease protein
MLTYLTRRLLIALVTLVLITFFIYGLIRAMPGDPTTLIMSEDPSRKISKADLDRQRAIYGLDKPWYVAYGVWMKNVLQLEFGYSRVQKQSVAGVIAERLGPTLLLSISSLCITYLVAVPLGLLAAARNGRVDERAMSTGLYMLYSFPTFAAAVFLQRSLAYEHDWFELTGMVSREYSQMSLGGKLLDIARHATLPLVCESYVGLAYYSRFVRANLMEVMRQDYVRTARAKGCSELRVLFRHAFRNTLIPLVTLIGLTLPALLSGSVIIERVFNWPGIGQLYFESILSRDYEVIMALTLVYALLTLLGTLLADILYAVVDPRVAYS